MTCKIAKSCKYEFIPIRFRSVFFQFSGTYSALWLEHIAVDALIILLLGNKTIGEKVVDRVLIIEIIDNAGINDDVVEVFYTYRLAYLIDEVADKDIQRRDILYLGVRLFRHFEDVFVMHDITSAEARIIEHIREKSDINGSLHTWNSLGDDTGILKTAAAFILNRLECNIEYDRHTR